MRTFSCGTREAYFLANPDGVSHACSAAQMNAKKVIIVLTCFSLSTVAIRGGCKSDCRDEFDSQVDSCKLLHDGHEEADDLMLCIQEAKDEFDDCIQECDE